MINILLVRHGETLQNREGICQGQMEGELSMKGWDQNHQLALNLKNMNFNACYSSPLHRAVETATTIAKFHAGLEIVKDQRLIERNMGILQGQIFPGDYSIHTTYKGMESFGDLSLRIKSFFANILPKHNNQTLILISHGLSLLFINAILNRRPIHSLELANMMPNASFIHLKIDSLEKYAQ